MTDRESFPTAQRLRQLIEKMAGRPVVMSVDLVADRFITGLPKRISREAPVLILEYEGETLVPGGGANAVANVAALGGQPLPLGVVGTDDPGHALLDALRSRGAPDDGIVQIDEYRTPTKTRILGGGKHGIKQQIVRYDIEDRARLSDAVRERFASALASWAGRSNVAVLSDYGYGAVTPDQVEQLRAALTEPAFVLCDSRYRLGEFSSIDGATPNEEEAESLAGESFDDDPERLSAAGRRLQESLGTRFLLITRGSWGMNLFESRGMAHIPVHGTDQVADVTGAGDTVIGTFALALAAEASPLEAALLANYAGGIVVQRLGTATVSPSELLEAVDSDPRPLEELQWEEW
jgi:rfaE bifunctional protein kinase chain/domain